MGKYIHKVHYYETDKMGITHHSNYIRFMEEARMHFFMEIGYPMTRLEAKGLASPVVAVQCEYKCPTTYNDEIESAVRVTGYTGVKLSLDYVMWNPSAEKVVATASSIHCFIDCSGRPIAVRKYFPELDAVLKRQGEQKA